MSNLQLEYQDAKTSLIMKPGNLDDFILTGNRLAWDAHARLNYRGDTYFEGKLRISTAAQTSQEEINDAFRKSDGGILRENHGVFVAKGVIIVKASVPELIDSHVIELDETIVLPIVRLTNWRIPLSQRLASIRNAKETKARDIPSSTVTVCVNARFSYSDRTPMHVETRFENFESRQVVSGGVPETNRRKF